MYIPSRFREDSFPLIKEVIDRYSFASLISLNDSELSASHLPLLLTQVDRKVAPEFEPSSDSDWSEWTLWGHMARANPQWRDLDGKRVLAIFHGPHCYVSPSWYESSNVVPTWNYIAVHVSGTFSVVEDFAAGREFLRLAVEKYEKNRATSWSMDGEGADFLDKLQQAIVVFRVILEQVEAKFKLSQNHSEERISQVIDGLDATGRSDELEVAAWMRRLSRPKQ